MEVGEHKLLFNSLPNNILDETLYTGDVLEHMLVCLANLAFYVDGG